jgi:hypothetical protein
MAGRGSEDFLAAEIDDVASAGIVGAPQVLLELVRRQISQHGDGAFFVSRRVTSANSSSVNPTKHRPVQQRPVPACSVKGFTVTSKLRLAIHQQAGTPESRDSRCALRAPEVLPRHCRIAAIPVNGAGTVARRTLRRPLAAGPVAQWLEPAAHNGLVPGSNPGRPTIKSRTYRFFIFLSRQKLRQNGGDRG